MTVREMIYALASHPMDAEVGTGCSSLHGWIAKIKRVGTTDDGVVVLDQEEDVILQDEVKTTFL